MKRYFLQNKKGVTLLEGLIALLLLAMIATGTFGVLLSTSRRSTQPDIREEMTLAVERAMDKMQVYVYPTGVSLPTNADVRNGLCGGTDIPAAKKIVDTEPLAGAGTHNIACLLPPICDASNSYFHYTVVEKTGDLPQGKIRSEDLRSGATSVKSPYSIKFDIQCNGFRL